MRDARGSSALSAPPAVWLALPATRVVIRLEVNHMMSHNVHSSNTMVALGEGKFQMIFTVRELYLLAA